MQGAIYDGFFDTHDARMEVLKFFWVAGNVENALWAIWAVWGKFTPK